MSENSIIINYSSMSHSEITQILYKKYKTLFYFILIIITFILTLYSFKKYYIYKKYQRLFSNNNLILYENKPKEVLSSNIIVDAHKFSIPGSQNCFTYSVFLYIKDWYVNYGKYKHIFHRGTDVIENYTQTCKTTISWKNIPEQYPGIWFDNTKNDMWITISTKVKEKSKSQNCDKNNNKPIYINTIEYAKLKNIPISSYFCLTAVFDKNKIELYINGKLKKTKLLLGEPIENNENGYIGIGNSFAGNIANFQYIPYSLYPDEVFYLYDNNRKKYKVITN